MSSDDQNWRSLRVSAGRYGGHSLTHARTAAHEPTALFRDEVWGPFTEGEGDLEQIESMKALSAHMQPMVVQALVTAFQRSLREELRAAFTSETG